MISESNCQLPTKDTLHRLWKYWILTLALVLLGTLSPQTEIMHKVFPIDTILHLVLYTVLAFIPMILFRCRKTSFLISLSMTPLGYLLESLHMTVTGENFNALNALASNIGVITGIATGFIVRLKSHYKRDRKVTQTENLPS
jgi:hypothetical protein